MHMFSFRMDGSCLNLYQHKPATATVVWIFWHGCWALCIKLPIAKQAHCYRGTKIAYVRSTTYLTLCPDSSSGQTHLCRTMQPCDLILLRIHAWHSQESSSSLRSSKGCYYFLKMSKTCTQTAVILLLNYLHLSNDSTQKVTARSGKKISVVLTD